MLINEVLGPDAGGPQRLVRPPADARQKHPLKVRRGKNPPFFLFFENFLVGLRLSNPPPYTRSHETEYRSRFCLPDILHPAPETDSLCVCPSAVWKFTESH